MTTLSDRLNNLDSLIADGRIIRGSWTGTDAHGRATACLLAALSPEAGQEKSPNACPASVMPAWLAHLTPWLDDAPSNEVWAEVVCRYARVARRWHALSAEDWRRLDYRCRAIALREARSSSRNDRALSAIDSVLRLLDIAGSGLSVSDREWYAAYAAAQAAREAAAAATWATLAAREAEAAAGAATWAAREAEAAAATQAARAAAAAAATQAAADRIVAAILDELEAAIIRREAACGGVR